MKITWKKYLLYASIVLALGSLGYILLETVKAKNTGFETKTLWDWMDLLIIPLFLAGGAFFLNRSESVVERQAAEDRAKLEREIALDRQQEGALQAYFDRMSELLLKEKLRTTEVPEVRDVARTRTISVMRVLDRRRNNLVIQFLREAKLLTDEKSILNGANMSGMNLEGLRFDEVYLQDAILTGANLRHTNFLAANLQRVSFWEANLQEAYLHSANLQKAHLYAANLQGANLVKANLQEANLQWANLIGAQLLRATIEGATLAFAKLQEAELKEADLRGSHLGDAKLDGANLEGANLQGATVTDEQLAKARSLKGATMPDGTIHD